MRYLLPTIVLLSMIFSCDAFGQRKELRKAKSAYDEEDYYHCMEYYLEAQELGGVLGLEDQKNLARSYFELNKIGAAFELYSELEADLTDEHVFIYAKVLHRVGLYEPAIEWYDKAKKTGNSLTESVIHVNDMIASCRWASANGDVTAAYRVNPNFALASQGQSFGVQIYNDMVVYSSAPNNSKNVDKNGNPFLNLYCSEIIDGQVAENTSALFSKNLESPYHVGAISFTNDKKHMFFTRSVYVDKESILKIFVVDFDGNDWVNERVVAFDSNDFDLAHPAVSPDDKYLYFVSNMPDHTKIFGKDVKNYGGKDIYRAEFNGDVNSFKSVENLGTEINTYGDEVYPVVNPDGKLYFSSDVRKGFGGLDIFIAEFVDGKWQNARNMLKPFNSEVDDFCYVQFPNDEQRAFLSSNRFGNRDQDVIFDVYPKVDTPEPEEEVAPVFGSDGEILEEEPAEPAPVVEEQPKEEEPVQPEPVVAEVIKEVPFSTNVVSTFKNMPIPDALVTVLDEETDAVIVSGKTDASGRITLSIPTASLADGKEVAISATKEGYNEKSIQLTQDEIEDVAREGIKMTPIFKDVNLDAISKMVIAYDQDLDDKAKATLDQLASILLQNPTVVVKINAHTEAKGNRYGNLDVSQKIADKAKDYLVSKGVNGDQLIPRGYGERYLKNRCHRGVYCDASQHKDNRRIEFQVWKDEK